MPFKTQPIENSKDALHAAYMKIIGELRGKAKAGNSDKEALKVDSTALSMVQAEIAQILTGLEPGNKSIPLWYDDCIRMCGEIKKAMPIDARPAADEVAAAIKHRYEDANKKWKEEQAKLKAKEAVETPAKPDEPVDTVVTEEAK